MPSFVDIHKRPAFFLKGKGGAVELGKRGGMGVLGRIGGWGRYDLIYYMCVEQAKKQTNKGPLFEKKKKEKKMSCTWIFWR